MIKRVQLHVDHRLYFRKVLWEASLAYAEGRHVVDGVALDRHVEICYVKLRNLLGVLTVLLEGRLKQETLSGREEDFSSTYEVVWGTVYVRFFGIRCGISFGADWHHCSPTLKCAVQIKITFLFTALIAVA